MMFYTPLKAVKHVGDMESLVGYYINICLTAQSLEKVRTMVTNKITDGAIDWSDSTIERIELKTFDSGIAFNCKEPMREGIWYVSGRSIFPGN